MTTTVILHHRQKDLQTDANSKNLQAFYLEPVTGIEPAIASLQNWCSASESFTGPRVFVSVELLLT